MQLTKLCALALVAFGDGAFAATITKPDKATRALSASTGTFTYNSKSFLLNGSPVQLLGGQMDPQRVPRAYWAQRLQMAKAMGLNTIFSYIYWHWHEQTQGNWNFTGLNDIAAFYQEVQNAGLHAVLRPGPYVCGERDWGGMPGWLAGISGLTVRANNAPFLNASAAYLNKIGQVLNASLVTNGGPILMVQVENEYGQNYQIDKTYSSNLANLFKTAFPGMLLYTTDGLNLQSGVIPGVLPEIDGDVSRFNDRNGYFTGPLLDGEYYTRWFSSWGPHSGFTTSAGDNNFVNGVLSDIKKIAGGGNSFSLYMYHGGSNFAFGNGGIDFGSGEQIFLQSYDYGAPLDESGRTTALYNSLRSTLSSYVSNIPAVPSTPALQSIASFPLSPVTGLFDALPAAISNSSPKNMEAIGQSFGYTLYEWTATASYSGKVQPGDKPRDRVIVYVNNVKKGVIDDIYKNPATVNVQLNTGDKLRLLVENQGRVDYGGGLPDQRKGIVGSVSVGGKTLSGPVNHYMLDPESPPSASNTATTMTVAANGPPVWYHGTFSNSASGMAADTYLALPGGVKGVVYINGINLGRYWTVGPQQQIYVPGAYLNQGSNDLWVLELEPGTAARTANGVATRSWRNDPDPDCSGC